MRKKEQPSPKMITAQGFVNVADIVEDLLYTKDNYAFGYLVLWGANDRLMNHKERIRFFDNVSAALEQEQEAFQIIAYPKTIDITNILNNLLKLKNKADNDAKLKLINGEIAYTKSMVLDDTKEPLRIIKVWERLGKNSLKNSLKERLAKMKSNLNTANISAEIMTNAEISNLCKIYSELNVYQMSDDEEEFHVLNKKDKKQRIQTNSDLLNMITPVGGLDFEVSKLIVGSTIGKVYAAIKYPASLDYGWLAGIMNSTEAITCLTYTPANSNELADSLSKTINRNIGDANSTHDHRERRQLMRKAGDADNIIAEIDEKNNAVGFFSIVVMPFSDSEEGFTDISRKVESLFRKQKIKIKCLGNLQKEGFKALSPYYTNQEVVDVIANRPFMLSTLSGGSPTLIDTFKDNNGIYFAKTKDGNKVILDMSYRGSDRTNSNFVVFGKSGTGKSTMVKSLIQTYFMLGYTVIIIDPETEYKELCQELGGSWINAGGGHAKINILQIKPVPLDDEDEDPKDILFDDKSSAMAMHMRTLEIFFKLYKPGMTDLQVSHLKRTLVELYKSKGIDWDTDITQLANTDFPIISELVAMLGKKAKKDDDYKTLEALLYDMAEGADSFIWNGHTNVDTDNQLICYDTKKLTNSSDEIKSTQYFNLISNAWKTMSENREQTVVLICDEAYLLVDENAPQAVMFLRNIEKRCRKYEGVLGIVTQQLIDFLGDKVAKYGQALIDMPTYKFIFGADAKNLKDAVEVFTLSEPEADVVAACQQRHAVGIIGSQKLHLEFELPQYKLDMMGKGGGRGWQSL